MNHIEEKILLKYIYILSVRQKIKYFEKKWFIPINIRSKKYWNDTLPMLLEI